MYLSAFHDMFVLCNIRIRRTTHKGSFFSENDFAYHIGEYEFQIIFYKKNYSISQIISITIYTQTLFGFRIFKQNKYQKKLWTVYLYNISNLRMYVYLI